MGRLTTVKFNLETPDSDLFTKEAREPYRSISLAPPPGPPVFEIQVLLTVPELSNNQVLVHMSPDSSRVRIEPTPRFILLETWTLAMTPHRPGSTMDPHSPDVALPIIYKHGIVLFRSLFSLLRVQPAWKFYKRLKRRSNRLGIRLRVRSEGDSILESSVFGFELGTENSILGAKPSSTHPSPLPTSTHAFPPVSHLLGTFTLSTTYLTTPDFQLDELESLLSSRFISLDLQGFIPTLDKNKQRDSITGSSLPTSSGIRSVMSRSPPKAIARATSNDSASVAERFILPSRVASMTPSLGSTANAGTSALIPPPRPFPSMNPSTTSINVPQQASGLAINRLRKESLNSLSSSSVSTRDVPIGGPNSNPGLSSLSSSPVSGPLPIRRPTINQVHPFKSNTFSSASGSSPSLSIRQAPGAIYGGGSPAGTPGVPQHTHSRQGSSSSPSGNIRPPPSPITSGFGVHPSPPGATSTFSPSSLGDRRPGTAESFASSDKDRRVSINSNRGGDESEDSRSNMPMPMPMPTRKRYSSSFGHRYAGSAGSAAGIGMSSGAASGSNEGRCPSQGGIAVASTPGSVNESEGSAPAGGSGKQGKKEGVPSFLSGYTDDDDISIFVQDIDSRKPLSGRVRERAKRDRDREELLIQHAQGHDRASTDTTIKAKDYPRKQLEDRMQPLNQRPQSGVFYVDEADIPYTTSPTNVQSLPPAAAGGPTTTSAMEDTAEERVAYLSTSPHRSPMLTNQNDVEERLKKMNETFMKSLEGISGSQRRKDKQRSVAATTSAAAAVVSPPPPAQEEKREKARQASSTGSSGSSSNDAAIAPFSRGLGMNIGVPARGDSDRGRYLPYGNPPSGHGLGLGRARHASTSSSTLATSEAGASQGSEEVIGRMDLYEERRRTGF
ncbi:hypothetical protein D9613_012304 [Agrocybe pediades]|uniref:Autophagy-related protein 13 n=1 Tax=Agrocybe pediades TaxID=84607 RepID=A0A8H4VHN4_9AGAR|nr:hypothetical protein D9613_012304 [Agrocybe pediades]